MEQRPLALEHRATNSLRPYERNARKHSKKQVRQIAASIDKYGFNTPILVTADGGVLAGHGRLEAAKLLGLEQVPTVCIDHLSKEEQRAFIIADNKLALNATWDSDLLAFELEELGASGFDLSLTGFSTTELDLIIEGAAEADPDREDRADGRADVVPELGKETVTRIGDVWLLGRHVLVCGDARKAADYKALMRGESADLLFTDPPYNCRINGHVSGLGKTKHREFVVVSGELTEAEFTDFLTAALCAAAAHCRDGAIAFVFNGLARHGRLACCRRESVH